MLILFLKYVFCSVRFCKQKGENGGCAEGNDRRFLSSTLAGGSPRPHRPPLAAAVQRHPLGPAASCRQGVWPSKGR